MSTELHEGDRNRKHSSDHQDLSDSQLLPTSPYHPERHSVSGSNDDQETQDNIPLRKSAHPRIPKVYTDSQPPSFCASCCTSLFGSRQLTSPADRESYIRATLLELAIYLVYLATGCIIVFGSMSSTDYYYTKVLSDLFLDTSFGETDFQSSTNLKDFWSFAEVAMPDGLYWEQWYHDKNLNKLVPPEDQGILYENRILGQPRLRQLRVKKIGCPVDQLLRAIRAECYPPYDTSLEDTKWNYKSESELGGRSYWGKLETYSGAGAVVLLSHNNRDETAAQIETLKQNLWITRATRVIFLEFTVYNANINMFCTVRLAWEFSVAGGLVTSWSLRAVRLIKYVTDWDYFLLVCEIIFILFTLFYTVQEVLEMCKLGMITYLSDFWSYLDLLILILSYMSIAFSIYRSVLVLQTIQPLLARQKGFADFNFLAFWETQFTNGIAICLFFVWIKIFKYISFNVTMSQLAITLSRCAKDIGGFAIMFFIVFFAFAQLGYLLFGSQVKGFSSIQDSIFTLLRLILGEFELEELEAANRLLGPIYFLSYVFFVFFVLLNMFLAIINDTYSEVKSEIQARRSQFQITDYLKQKFYVIGNTIRKGSTNSYVVRPSSVAAADDGKITQAELKSHLVDANFMDTDVDLFLARYQLDQDHVLDEEETTTIIDHLEGRKHKSLTNDDRLAMTEKAKNMEMAQLDNRITAMEYSLTGVLGKMDKLITKMSPQGDH